MNVIDGKKLSTEIRASIKDELINTNGSRVPNLSVILVGSNDASKTYVRFKEKACNEVGISSDTYLFEDDVTKDVLISKIHELNNDEGVDGILVQLPLPNHINTYEVLSHISPTKDVDGFHSINTGLLALNREEAIVPCTPKGILKLLEYYNVSIEGKTVCVVGRSNIVGRPMTELLLNLNATVINCNIYENDIKRFTSISDILIVATGNSKLITKDMVKEDSVVIDVGINRVNGKLVGDVDYDNVKDKVKLITPVPGGVGPMTIAMLLQNTFEIYKKRGINNG